MKNNSPAAEARLTAKAIALSAIVAIAAQAVIVDRVAVIVGTRVVKTSDIDRDLRVTEFLNREPLDIGTSAKQKAAERLIDQTIIRDAMEKGAYTRSNTEDLEAMLRQVRQDRFGGSDTRLRSELVRYGLTEELLRIQLQWQLDVLKFLDERFRPGVLVTDDEVRTYYNQHVAELRRSYPQATTYEALAPKIRASLEGERLNQNFDQWVAAARKRYRIEYRQEAFQ